MEPKHQSFLRNKRRSWGLTIRELAKAIGISPHTISLMEYGKNACGELNARRLGEYFGVDWKKFLSEKYDEPKKHTYTR